MKFFTNDNVKTFIPIINPQIHFHKCIWKQTHIHTFVYNSWIISTESDAGSSVSWTDLFFCVSLETSPLWGLIWCLPLLLSLLGQEPLSLCTITPWCGLSLLRVLFTLGPCWLSPALLQRCLHYRQRHYKRQRLVQASVRPLFYQSVRMRPLKAMTTQLALDYPFTATFCLTIELNNWLFL